MIIDASIAVPWLIDTPFSAPARKLKSQEDCAPSLVLVETTNALLKYLRAGVMTLDQILAVIGTLPAVLSIVENARILPEATAIAAAHNHKIYDCLYLALAQERRQPLATADRRMAALARRLGIDTELVEPLL